MLSPDVHTRKLQSKQVSQGGRKITAALLTSGLAAVAAAPLLHAAPPAASGKAVKPAKTAKAVTSTNKPGVVLLAGDNTPLTDEQKILHVLNRMGFGPRPGDVAKVKALGIHRYIEQQLNPEKIDDSAAEAKVAGLTLVKRSPQEMAQLYQMRQDKTAKLLRKKQTDGMQTAQNMTPANETPMEKMRRGRAMLASLTPDEQETVRQYMQAQQQVGQAGVQLALDKTVRAAESERQFQEVMVDFWSNHFNIDVRKGPCIAYKISDERDVIRPHVFGSFRELLGASAKSPAMLIYLDNAQSQAPRPDTPQEKRRQQMRQRIVAQAAANGNATAQLAQQAPKKGQGGINENYAREIMELHTLGVDGGYTQKDVQEVARCLTGWTINRQDGTFQFTPRRHDDGEKVVLGKTIPAGGGIKDGETVLDMLASNPATMRFISTKLCRRLVSDEPPPSLVDKCVVTWKKTNGDLRSIYRTIVTSPEFFSRAAYHQKVKSPFEYAVSSVRALDGHFDLGTIEEDRPRFRLAANKKGGNNPGQNVTIAGQVGIMGQPLYQYQAPTGYSEDSRKWVSSGALISRLNFALALTGGKMIDIDLPTANLAMGTKPSDTVEYLSAHLLNGEMTPSTRATLLKQAETSPSATLAQNTTTDARLAALVLGSPEFQRK